MADPNLAHLQLFYTGGGSNSVPSASIGGAISSTRILSQTASALTTLSGVVIDDAMGNAPGDGILTYTASTTSLSWQPYQGSTGTAVDVSDGGKFFIQGANNGGGVCVTVTFAALPTSTVSNTVTIANQVNKFFADQTKAESDAGVTKYHCFAIKNNHITYPTGSLSFGAASGSGVTVTGTGTSFVAGDVGKIISVDDGKQATITAYSLATSVTVDITGTLSTTTFANNLWGTGLPMVDVSIWIGSNTPGADHDSLYLDPLAASFGATGPTAVANENTAPSGSTFVVPDSLTHADVLNVGTLTAGQCKFLWVKQATPASVTVATEANTFIPVLYMRA